MDFMAHRISFLKRFDSISKLWRLLPYASSIPSIKRKEKKRKQKLQRNYETTLTIVHHSTDSKYIFFRDYKNSTSGTRYEQRVAVAQTYVG